MKINTKTTLLAIVVTLVYSVCLVVAIFCALNKIQLNRLFFILSEVAYITPIIYITMILNHLKESKSIRVAYWAYIVCDIGMIVFYIMTKPSGHSIGTYLFSRILALSITLILIIQSFRIKNPILVYPFSLYWIGLLMILFIKLIGWVTMIQKWTVKIFQFSLIAEILLPVSMLYILFQTLKYLASEKVIESPLLKTDDEMGEY